MNSVEMFTIWPSVLLHYSAAIFGTEDRGDQVGFENSIQSLRSNILEQFWKKPHQDYFKLQLTDWGHEWSDQLRVVLESFDVVMANPARPV